MKTRTRKIVSRMIPTRQWWAGIYLVEYCLVGTYIRRIFLDYNNPSGNFPGGSYTGWEFSGWEFSRWELSWVGIVWVGVILGGNFLWWGFSGWKLSRGNHSGGNFPGGSFPSTQYCTPLSQSDCRYFFVLAITSTNIQLLMQNEVNNWQ